MHIIECQTSYFPTKIQILEFVRDCALQEWTWYSQPMYLLHEKGAIERLEGQTLFLLFSRHHRRYLKRPRPFLHRGLHPSLITAKSSPGAARHLPRSVVAEERDVLADFIPLLLDDAFRYPHQVADFLRGSFSIFKRIAIRLEHCRDMYEVQKSMLSKSRDGGTWSIPHYVCSFLKRYPCSWNSVPDGT